MDIEVICIEVYITSFSASNVGNMLLDSSPTVGVVYASLFHVNPLTRGLTINLETPVHITNIILDQL